MDEEYALYVRKSRMDIELEEKGAEETLKRHETKLLRLALEKNYHISKIYREVVSGETIASRPKMLELLSDIEKGLYAGVLVVELERLARGDTTDQGIIAQTFKFSDTKIITPNREYDPNNELDEDFFEFSLFMSRREYKTIKKRFREGRESSAREGKYACSVPPYGYDRKKLKGEKGFILVEDKKEGEILKLIFQLYVYEGKSMNQIAEHLNKLGVKPRHSDYWTIANLTCIIANPVYVGNIVWNTSTTKKISINGDVKTKRIKNPREKWIQSKGLHKALVDNETWNLAQQKKALNAPKVHVSQELKNSLAGVIICGKCGKPMQRRPYSDGRPATMICTNKNCNNISCDYEILETQVVKAIKSWLDGYVLENKRHVDKCDNTRILNNSIKKTIEEIKKLEKKQEKLCEFLEDGTYTKELFLSRSNSITNELTTLKKELKDYNATLEQEEVNRNAKTELIPKATKLIDVFDTGLTAEEKNILLKEVVSKIEYTKEKRIPKGGDLTKFELKIYPKNISGN